MMQFGDRPRDAVGPSGLQRSGVGSQEVSRYSDRSRAVAGPSGLQRNGSVHRETSQFVDRSRAVARSVNRDLIFDYERRDLHRPAHRTGHGSFDNGAPPERRSRSIGRPIVEFRGKPV